MSLATPAAGAAGTTASSGDAQVSVMAAWDQGPSSVDLMRAALSQQVVAGFEVLLAPTALRAGASSRTGVVQLHPLHHPELRA